MLCLARMATRSFAKAVFLDECAEATMAQDAEQCVCSQPG